MVGEPTAPFGGLRWSAIWRAAGAMAIFLVPVGLLQASQEGAAALILTGVILFLGMVAGFGAAKLAWERPIPNGAAAGALAYLFVQGAGFIRRAVADEDLPSIVSVIYLALLMATCGMVGAALERRTRALRVTADGPTGDEGETTR